MLCGVLKAEAMAGLASTKFWGRQDARLSLNKNPSALDLFHINNLYHLLHIYFSVKNSPVDPERTIQLVKSFQIGLQFVFDTSTTIYVIASLVSHSHYVDYMLPVMLPADACTKFTMYHQ